MSPFRFHLPVCVHLYSLFICCSISCFRLSIFFVHLKTFYVSYYEYLIIPHSLQYELRSTDLKPRVGDLVVVYLRCTGKGRKRRQVTQSGVVVEVDSSAYGISLDRADAGPKFLPDRTYQEV